MKRLAILIPTLAAALIIYAVPSLSEEGATMAGQENINLQKDDCLLVALNCPDNVDTLQQRIDKLQAEITKGTTVYTSDELEILNRKLNDARENQRDLIERY